MKNLELLEGVYDVNLEIDAEAYETRQETVIRATAYPLYQSTTGMYRESDTIHPNEFSFTVQVPEGVDFIEDVMGNQDETWIDSDAPGVPAWLTEQIKRAAQKEG
jgi:hypothetical protein